MPQAVFSKAVQKFLPSAIPTQLEKIDEYSVGKVLIYSKKPRKLIPMRKHDLDFTGFSLQTLQPEKEELQISSARTFLFDTDKSISSKSVNVDVGGDLDLENALTKLFSTKLDFKLKAKEQKNLSITTDFGKLTHISTDLVTSVCKRKIRVDPENAVVKKAVERGGVMFVITDIYEAERCNVTVTLTKDMSETGGADVEATKAATKDSEDMDDKHTSTKVMKRDQPTPLAYLLMKVSVDGKGVVTSKLNTQLSSKLHGKPTKITRKSIAEYAVKSISDPYQDWVVIDIQAVKNSEPAITESLMTCSEDSEVFEEPASVEGASPQQLKAGLSEDGGKEAEVKFPIPIPLSEVPGATPTPASAVKVKKVGDLGAPKPGTGATKTEAKPIPAAADAADGGPDDHYIYSLKDFQPFETKTYRGILGECKEWVAPLIANAKLHKAFFDYIKPPKTYERLNDLSAYFLEVGNAMRAKKTPPPNTLKDIDPIMDALTPTEQGSEKRLSEITSVIVVAEAADEFPQHILPKIIELPADKRELLMNIILETPYNSSRHTYADEGPFKDPALRPIMGRIGFSIPSGTHNLVHARKESDEEEDSLAATLIFLLASETM